MQKDYEAVEKTVQYYIDGVGRGDAATLKKAFHPNARMYGSIGGTRYDVPISEMIEMIAAKPADTGSYKARFENVTVVGDCAIAELHEEGFWGALSFTDFFSLAKIDGEWTVVNKVFAHTGGELPKA